MRSRLKILVCSGVFLCAQVWGTPWWPWMVEDPLPRIFNLSHVLELEQILSNRVIEQPYAVKAVAEMMIAYKAGIHDSDQPIGACLFIGSTGVGKTELAKTLAEEVTSSLDQFIRLNMSEFSAKESGVYRLIGAPWSYKENEKGGELSNAILANPYSVVLLDEFEKAHLDVRLLFLHIFDEGYFTTAKGVRVDCRNCIFIATTNVASALIEEAWRQGFHYDQIMSCIQPELISAFTPELYGRMQPILFQNITATALKQIVHIKLKEIASRLKEKQDIEVIFDDSLIEYVFGQCCKDDGVRSVLRVVRRDVLAALARALVENIFQRGCSLFVTHDGTAVRVSLL